MASLANTIEVYLRQMVTAAEDGVVEVQRSELAQRFGCAPSQINYVLETRFTPERGYLVESRRGGGGYIRLIRIPVDLSQEVLALAEQLLGQATSQEKGEQFILRLHDEGLVSRREAGLMLAAIDRDTIGVDLPLRDVIRARLLNAMLRAILRYE